MNSAPADNVSDESRTASLVDALVTGEVSNVLYTSEDEQYSILTVVDHNHQELTLVGPIAGLTVGQELEAHGRWERHREYGRQFKVNSYKALMPSTEDGIRRYLGSGIITGIGPKMADRIVDRFGKDTLKILEHYSGRLTEVKGLGKGRLQTIREAWTSQVAQRDTNIFLHGLGVSRAYCARIQRKYGDNTVQVVSENPYRLATEVKGIGFKMSDVIAQHLNIAPDHPYRIGSGIVYTLQQLSNQQGHTCYPREELVEKAAETLEQPHDLVAKGVTRAIQDGALMESAVGEKAYLYHVDLYRAEVALAAHVRAMLNRRPTHSVQRLPVGQQWKILNPAQKQAVEAAFAHTLSVITGGPGVGKTTVTREIVQVARSLQMRISLAAPTGRAAKRLSESSGYEAQTIHRLLKWEPVSADFTHNSQNPLPADLLIVDEVSMLDVRLGVSLFNAVSPTATVILVGDRDQLPSVGPGSVLRDLIADRQITVTHLTEVYRQAAQSRIIQGARRVNEGKLPVLTCDSKELQDFYWIEQEDPDKVIDIIRRLIEERIPQRFGLSAREDIQVLTPINRGECGTFNLNRVIQERINPGKPSDPTFNFGETVFRLHDRVMQTVNNYELNTFNGDQGYIVSIDPTQQTFQVRYDTHTATYPIADADQLRLAYAVTVHKSQGSEFPAVIIPVLTQHYIMLQRKLIYTAMTRARNLLVMIGSKRALAMAANNVNQSPRYSLLSYRLRRSDTF